MELSDYLHDMNSGKTVAAGSEEMMYSGYLTQEALKITAEINCGYHTPEELQEWLENRIREQVEAGASRQFLVNAPSKQYNALVEDAFYDDEAGRAAAATRLGEGSVRVALLEPEQYEQLQPWLREKNGVIRAEVWDKNTAEAVMLQSVSIAENRFGRELSGLSYIEGGKLLSGTRIIRMENGCCPLEGGGQLCSDPELGVIIRGR